MSVWCVCQHGADYHGPGCEVDDCDCGFFTVAGYVQPAPDRAAGLREEVIVLIEYMTATPRTDWSDVHLGELAALLDSDKPGLDVERLAKTLDSLGWPLRHRRMTAEWIAAEYARLEGASDGE